MTKAELLNELAAHEWFGGFIEPDGANVLRDGAAKIELVRPQENRATTYRDGKNIFRVYFLEVAGKVAVSRSCDIVELPDGRAFFKDSEPGPTINSNPRG